MSPDMGEEQKQFNDRKDGEKKVIPTGIKRNEDLPFPNIWFMHLPRISEVWGQEQR